MTGLPVEYDKVTVSGRYVYLDGKPVVGSVEFRGKIVQVADASGDLIVPTTLIAFLDQSGYFSIDLPATDDPDLSNPGWTYKVTERFHNGGGRTFELPVPIAAASGGIDISDVAPNEPPSDGDPTTFATVEALADLQAMIISGTELQAIADEAQAAADAAEAAAAEAASGGLVTIEASGAVGDDSTDNTAAIQAALDAARTAGGGVVRIPKGTFRTGPLTIGSRVSLEGMGYESVLKGRAVAGPLIQTYNGSVDLIQIKNMTIDAWLMTSGSAIYLQNTATGYENNYNDAHHLLENLFIVGAAGNGVWIGDQSRENRLINVQVRDPRGGHGFYVEGTDNNLALCTAATSRTPYHGFYVHSSNNRLVGCKAFYCGLVTEASDGFNIDRGRNSLAACESQDNGRYGFNINGSAELTTLTGALADSNGAAGIRMDNTTSNARGVTISGFITLNRTGGRYTQPYGLQFAGTPTGSSFQGVARNNGTKDVDGVATKGTVLVAAATGDMGQRIVGTGLELEGGGVGSRQGAYNTPADLIAGEHIHADDSNNATSSTLAMKLGFQSTAAPAAATKWAGIRATRDAAFAADVGLEFWTTRSSTAVRRAKFQAGGGLEIYDASTVPSAVPSSGGGGVLFSQAGALKWYQSGGAITLGSGGGGSAGKPTTKYVAASNAPAGEIAMADYTCDGTADEVQIQNAFGAVKTAGGGRVLLSQGTFNISSSIFLNGTADVDLSPLVAIQGAGNFSTKLVGALNVTIFDISQIARLHISDIGFFPQGTGHGIYSHAANDGIYRSFDESVFERLHFNGGYSNHTGWGMKLGSPFRSSVRDIHMEGVGNGMQMSAEWAAQAPGDCVFERMMIGVYGANAVAYHISSELASCNQNTYITCHCFAEVTDVGTVGWKLDGSYGTNHAVLIGCNIEEFATSWKQVGGLGNKVHFTHCTVKSGGTMFDITSDGRYGFYECADVYFDANGMMVNDQNTVTQKPNSYKFQGYIETGKTITTNMGACGYVVESDFTVESGATFPAVLQKSPNIKQAKAVTLTDAATVAINAELGELFKCVLGGDRTIGVPTNPRDGQRITLMLTASGAARTATLSTATGGFVFGTTITALTQIVSGKTDYIDCIYSSSPNKWRVVNYQKGF